VRNKAGVTERMMFGGIAFMLRGHMFVGVTDSRLMARVGPDNYEIALAKPGAREMDFTGKPMRGYVFVDADAVKKSSDLKRWVELSLAFVATLPGKAK
jgi:TfoX/Sxy family transcriptional regulator of competence genes